MVVFLGGGTVSSVTFYLIDGVIKGRTVGAGYGGTTEGVLQPPIKAAQRQR